MPRNPRWIDAPGYRLEARANRNGDGRFKLRSLRRIVVLALSSLLVMLPLPLRLVAQIPPEVAALTDSAQKLLVSGRARMNLGTPTSRKDALRLFKTALRLMDQEPRLFDGDQKVRGVVRYAVGSIHHALGEGDSANLYLQDALRLQRDAGDQSGEAFTLNNLGAVHDDLGRRQEAMGYYKSALSIWRNRHDRRNEGGTLNNIGRLYLHSGVADSALVYYTAALDRAREVGNREGEGRTLGGIGSAYDRLGHPDSSRAYYELALAVQSAAGDTRGHATTLNSIGQWHTNIGRPDSAVQYHRQALRGLREVGDQLSEGRTLNNMGIAFVEMGQQDSAVKYLTQAILVAKRIGDHSGLGRSANNLAALSLRSGETETAQILVSALENIGKIQDREAEGWIRANAGILHTRLAIAEKGSTDVTARDHTRQAEEALREALGIFRELHNPYGESETLGALGLLWHRGPRSNLAAAVAWYDSAASARALLQGAPGTDSDRLSSGETFVRLFGSWSLAWLARSAEVGARTAAVAALAAAEQGRAQALLALMRKAGHVRPIGGNLVSQGDSLIRAATRSGSTIVYYLMTNDTLITWVASPSGAVNAYRSAVSRDSLTTLIQAYRMGLGVDEASRLADERTVEALEWTRGTKVARRSTSEGSDAAAALAVLLIPHAVTDLEAGAELLIVPHGPLALIPFAALRTADGDHYFGESYALRYAPSLASAVEASQRPMGELGVLSRNALVVGNPLMPSRMLTTGEGYELPPLPGAAREAFEIAQQLGTGLVRDTAATESSVRASFPDASVIHLATHGFAFSSDARAADSFVALGPDPDNDGFLTVSEILDGDDLVAELVVLSACQTGLGNLKEAEGTVGFQRAFLAQGARSVLVSLWSVSDEATRELMGAFYQHWLDDDDAPTKSEALRRAQRDVRSIDGFEHPRFWAAFQLVGAG